MNFIPDDKSRRYLLFALILSTLLAIWAQWSRLADPYAVDEDFRNLYWIHRQQDPELFPATPLTDRGILSLALGPWTFTFQDASPGYSLLYQIATEFVAPILFSKLLIFPLLLITVFYIYRIAELLADSDIALALSLAFTIFQLTAPTAISVVAGLHRSFAFPIMVATVYYLLKRRYVLASVSTFAAGIVYLPIFPTLTVTYILSVIEVRRRPNWSLKIDWPKLLPLSLTVLLVLVAIHPLLLRILQGKEAAIINDSQHILSDPNYAAGGRYPLFLFPPFIGRAGIFTNPRTPLLLTPFLLLGVLVWRMGRNNLKPLPTVLKQLLYASIMTFTLAWLAIIFTSSFILYEPSRHIGSSLVLVIFFFVFINLRQAILRIIEWLLLHWRTFVVSTILPLSILTLIMVAFLPYIQRDHFSDTLWLRIARWLLLGLTLIIIALARITLHRERHNADLMNHHEFESPDFRIKVIAGLLLLLPSIITIHALKPSFHSPDPEIKELLAHLETLPPNSLIAGEPCTLDSVPLYAHRSVLISCEEFRSLRERIILDALTAYYAQDREEVLHLCNQYKVDYLVVDAESYSPENLETGNIFFEPYRSQLNLILEDHTSFYLSQLPAEVYLFESGNTFVVECSEKWLPVTN